MACNNDKTLEYQRYDSRATSQLSGTEKFSFISGSEELAQALRFPYFLYEEKIKLNVLSDKTRVLEVGAGTGTFTENLLRTGAEVHATDISENSLRIIEKKAESFDNLNVKIVDMESLPFDDGYFDVVTSAGSLSYGDNEIVLSEIYRVLKKEGVFICVDSLNHNPVYRFNRWIHYIKKNRSLSTLRRMPTMSLLKSYDKKFGYIDIQYFGAIVWMLPLLKFFFNEKKNADIVEKADAFLKTKKSAFKFVMVAKKIR